MLTFDLAVTPSEAFAKFWENDYYARVLEEKCSNEDVTFEPWCHDDPKTRKVNTQTSVGQGHQHARHLV